jgi:hypothetical protein
VFLQKFITEYTNNYKYFSYATYIQTKSNQYDNAVEEAYGYNIYSVITEVFRGVSSVPGKCRESTLNLATATSLLIVSIIHNHPIIIHTIVSVTEIVIK